MNHRRLGATGPEASAIGLGCMGMSDFYGPADRSESIATIHAALDAGRTAAAGWRKVRRRDTISALCPVKTKPAPPTRSRSSRPIST
jgi:hypothetical protein